MAREDDVRLDDDNFTFPVEHLKLLGSLRFIRGFFTAMNSPAALLRLIQVVDQDTLIDDSLAGIVLQPNY